MKLYEFRRIMSQKGIDAALITEEINQRYFSEFAFSDGYLLILPQKAYAITDFRYAEEMKKEISAEFEVVTPSKLSEFIKEILSDEGVKTFGFEKSLSYSAFLSLQKEYSEYELISLEDIIEELREIKSPDEIEFIKKAQSITDAAFLHILNVMNPNMTELEIALELEFFMRKNGAEDVAFETIAVSGDLSAVPHGKPRGSRLQKGFLTMDFGAKYRGYCSDMTRTVSIGKATAEMKRIYETVLDAQLSALSVIKPEENAAAVDAVARNIINYAGYEGCFGHSLGHGVGLYIHEKPNLSPRSKEKYLKSGNVVTVEPGIYIEGNCGCRIEDMVLITDTGLYDFTKSSKTLIEFFA